MSRRKRLGQHFMVDGRVLQREVEYAGVEGKEVLEVGAGTGNLTKVIAEKAERVIAVEKDRQLLPVLFAELSRYGNVEVVCADILKMDIPSVDVIISNVPYSISSPLVFRLPEAEFSHAVLCMQREFVDRMVAMPGTPEYSRLSVMAQLQFEIEVLEYVPRMAFRPMPKVDSAIVRLRKRGYVDEVDGRIINALFQHKKKSVRAALSNSHSFLGIERERFKEIKDERKVFKLSLEEIVDLCDFVKGMLTA